MKIVDVKPFKTYLLNSKEQEELQKIFFQKGGFRAHGDQKVFILSLGSYCYFHKIDGIFCMIQSEDKLMWQVNNLPLFHFNKAKGVFLDCEDAPQICRRCGSKLSQNLLQQTETGCTLCDSLAKDIDKIFKITEHSLRLD